MMSWSISGVPRITQTTISTRALMGRKPASALRMPGRAAPAEKGQGLPLVHGAEGHHQAQGQGKDQGQYE